MLTQSEKETILSEFPNIKLSYENVVYKKVYNSDYIVAIPQGKKCFAWFTSFNDQMVCFIMELTNNKQVMNIQITNACFSDELAYGTILYGTIFYHSNNKFFCIEDIFCYKGTNIDRMCWGEKLAKMNHMLKKDLKQVSYNHSFLVFGLPLMSKTNEELENLIRGVTYDIETVQYKLFSRVNAYLYMDYSVYKSQISQTAQVLQYANYSSSKINRETPRPTETPRLRLTETPNPRPTETPNPRPTERRPIKRDVVFNVKPDVQNDIYYLYCLNDMQQEEQHSITHIPDYNTSVMMNKLFRIIKENDNLDALEESDDEEEFENENADKFVRLDSSYKMVCQFNHKFKKWVPIRVVTDDTTNIITNDELKYIYNLYAENKNKKQYEAKKPYETKKPYDEKKMPRYSNTYRR